MRFSLLQVVAVGHLTPRMRRITLDGAGLADFASVAPDQQCKLFFAKPGQGAPSVPQMNVDADTVRWYDSFLAMPEDERPWMRSYTVRRHHPDRGQIDIDFVLHDGDAGPASRWAAGATPGDTVGMLGPAASHLRTPGGPDRWLVAGDETALPAIGALVEALPAGTPAAVYVEVADADEQQRWATAGDITVRWLHRSEAPAGRTDLLLDAVRGAEPGSGRLFAWVAGEASTVRALRRHLVTERGVDKRSVAFVGYWRRHLAQDDPPTTEDEREQAEALAELSQRRETHQ